MAAARLAALLVVVYAHAGDDVEHAEYGEPAHNCVHDAMHAAHSIEPRTVAPQSYLPRPGSLEKRSGELEPSDGVAPMRIAVYDGYLESDPGLTCYKEGDLFSVGGADDRAPECSAETTTYCRGRCTREFVLTSEKRRFLQEMLVPELMRITRTLLSVQPVSGGLVLSGGSCGFYGGVRIPQSLTVEPGMPNADFVLFLTARPIYGDTIAYAGHCQTDQNGRPIAAHFNWSPSHFQDRMDARLFAYYTRVALHELTHALVFSPSLIADFPRGEDGRLRSLEAIPSWHGHQRAVVSPRVTAAARAQLGCDSLQGAHLEDGGGTGSAGSHWESRLFRDEYMTAAASPGPRVLSAITLALFADSGWYVVDGSQAEPLLWGLRAGCAFVERSCAAWHELGTSVDGVALPAFTCDEHSADACHYDQRSKAYCELKRYSWLPEELRYFAPADQTLGGYSQMLDYCPVFRAYSNGDCTDATNAPGALGPPIAFVDALDGDASVSLFGPRLVDQSQFCPSCRCFETDAISPAMPQGGGGRESALAPGCFRFRCIDQRTLQLHLGDGRWAGCPEAGGVARLPSTDAHGKALHIRCPPAARLCAFRADMWPRISSVSPRRGPVAGGTNVTMVGSNFDVTAAPPAVYVGETRAKEVTVHSPTLLTFVLGAERGATSRLLLDVSLEDSVGRSAVAFRAFTYMPGWQPYAETAAMLAVLLAMALWVVPKHVTHLLAEHARHVRAREQRMRQAAAKAAAATELELGAPAAEVAARAQSPAEAGMRPRVPAMRPRGKCSSSSSGASSGEAMLPAGRAGSGAAGKLSDGRAARADTAYTSDRLL